MRAVIFLTSLALAAPALSQESVQPWGSRDFSARRISVPQEGTRRSLVQIDPNEEPYFITPATGAGTKPPGGGSDAVIPNGEPFGWFWSAVSPKLEAANADRLDQAVAQLSASPDSLLPEWASISGLVSDLGRDALIATLEARVSPALVLAVISVESGGNKYALSPAGAMGVMQLMPATAERFKVIDASDAFQNIQGGVRYLDFLLRKFDGDPILALAAYNAGEGAVERNKGVPPYKETRGYVPKVLAAWQVARMFCQTPPLAVTDPCAFSAVGDG